MNRFARRSNVAHNLFECVEKEENSKRAENSF